MVLEILRFVTSDFFTFIGATTFTVSVILSIGWALNALVIGFRGIKADSAITLT